MSAAAKAAVPIEMGNVSPLEVTVLPQAFRVGAV